MIYFSLLIFNMKGYYMHCPNCQSTELQKRGKRGGKYRYKCKECGAYFTESTEYRPRINLDPIRDVKCPQCGSPLILRDGKLSSGGQRYRCKNCNLRFSPSTSLQRKNKIQYKCPYCEGELKYSGYNRNGNQKYQCKICGKSCSASDASGKPAKRELPFHLVNSEKECPYCRTLNIKKAGHLKSGAQRYMCNECGKIFSDNTTVRCGSTQVIELLLTGENLQKVVSMSGYSREYIRKLMAPHYVKETISKEQENLIIKYGYYLKVPVDYMAKYIKCSEHKCTEILRKYNGKIKSTIHDAT